MATHDFSFVNPQGEHLAGKLEMPDAPVRGWALMAHCFACGKDSLAGVYLARSLARAGVGTLRFDFAGVGASEGAFFAGGIEGDVRDVVCAAEAMTKAGMAPVLLVGHSLGGTAVIAAAADIVSVRAVASINAPFFGAGTPSSWKKGSHVDAGTHVVRLPSEEHDWEGVERHRYRIKSLGRPLLVMHAPDDTFVSLSNGETIFSTASQPKSFIALDGADHFLTQRDQTEYVGTMLVAWASRCLDSVHETREPRRPGDVVAVATGAGQFQVEIQAGDTHFLADEPVSYGGMASGLTPYDLVCAGLAACTTMTVGLYVRRQGLPVQGIRTAVRHVKDKTQAAADLFSRTISFEGVLPTEHLAGLMEAAERCPVELTLSAGARVETHLAEPPAEEGAVGAHARAMDQTVEAAKDVGA